MNRITHFELVTSDFEKTAAFYRAVFGWKVDKWEGPVDYWVITVRRCKHPRHQWRSYGRWRAFHRNGQYHRSR